MLCAESQPNFPSLRRPVLLWKGQDGSPGCAAAGGEAWPKGNPHGSRVSAKGLAEHRKFTGFKAFGRIEAHRETPARCKLRPATVPYHRCLNPQSLWPPSAHIWRPKTPHIRSLTFRLGRTQLATGRITVPPIPPSCDAALSTSRNVMFSRDCSLQNSREQVVTTQFF